MTLFKIYWGSIHGALKFLRSTGLTNKALFPVSSSFIMSFFCDGKCWWPCNSFSFITDSIDASSFRHYYLDILFISYLEIKENQARRYKSETELRPLPHLRRSYLFQYLMPFNYYRKGLCRRWYKIPRSASSNNHISSNIDQIRTFLLCVPWLLCTFTDKRISNTWDVLFISGSFLQYFCILSFPVTYIKGNYCIAEKLGQGYLQPNCVMDQILRNTWALRKLMHFGMDYARNRNNRRFY